MNCTRCGHDAPEGAMFCSGCGAELAKSPGIAGKQGQGYPSPRVNFQDAVNLGFQRYFQVRDRSRRSEYWWWQLFGVLVSLCVLPLDIWMGTIDQTGGGGLIAGRFGLIGGIFNLAVLVPSITLTVRRLHDINRSGWWCLLVAFSWAIIPYLLLLYWAIQPGTHGPNQYGADPREPVGHHALFQPEA